MAILPNADGGINMYRRGSIRNIRAVRNIFFSDGVGGRFGRRWQSIMVVGNTQVTTLRLAEQLLLSE